MAPYHLGDYRTENAHWEQKKKKVVEQSRQDELFLSNVEQIQKKNILGVEEIKQYLMV